MFRRSLAIFLMLILPLQLAWAAAGAYCQHETGREALHFGHHEHHHDAGSEAGQGVAAEGKIAGDRLADPGAAADNDCSAHLNGFNCSSGRILLPAPAQATVFVEPAAWPPSSFCPEGPERPDRRVAA